MSPHNSPDKIDELANDLDEMKTSTDELAEDPPSGVQPETIDTLREELEKASDTADKLEDQKE